MNAKWSEPFQYVQVPPKYKVFYKKIKHLKNIKIKYN